LPLRARRTGHVIPNLLGKKYPEGSELTNPWNVVLGEDINFFSKKQEESIQFQFFSCDCFAQRLYFRKDFRREMNERLDSLIKWTVGTLALFGTLIIIVLAVGQFMK
jgi:hypothetical protein